MYDPLTLQASKTISRFKDVALSCAFRPDGRLLSASSQDGHVQTFDTQSRLILRTYTGHTGPVWSVAHSKGFGTLLSGGDDREVRVWDVSSGEVVTRWQGHTDYVRTVREEADGENVVVSGSYDGTVRYWDRRVRDGDACTLTLTHGAPVSAFVLIPASAASSSLSIVTAGDVFVKAWDVRYVRAEGEGQEGVAPVKALSSHQKAITSLSHDAAYSRLLSSSLDGFVKVTALPSLMALSSIKVGAPLLACALSPDSTTLAVGGVDGALTLRQRPAPPLPPAPRPLPRMGSHAWFNRGMHSTPSPSSSLDASVAPRRATLQPYDVYLKRFQYHQALDAALRTNRAIVISSMLDELIDRGGLVVAISGRDEDGVRPLLAWLLNYVSHPAYSGLVLDVMGAVLRVYGGVVGESVVVDDWLRRVQGKVGEEVRVMEAMMAMRGGMELIWRGSERLAELPSAANEDGAERGELVEGESQHQPVDKLTVEEMKVEQTDESEEGRNEPIIAAARSSHGRARKGEDGERLDEEADEVSDREAPAVKAKAKRKRTKSGGAMEELEPPSSAAKGARRKSAKG